MRRRRRNHADEVHVIALDQFLPVIRHVLNLKFRGDLLRVLAVAAGNRNDARVFTILETGNLRRARKASANNADTNCFFRIQDGTFLQLFRQTEAPN